MLAVALTAGLIVFGITVLLTGEDGGLRPAEPDGRSLALPADRPLVEADLERVRFDTAPRGYRMAQVDAALRRVAYDVGYKDELTRVLLAEVEALREGRFPEAEVLRRAREAALAPVVPEGEPEPGAAPASPAPDGAELDGAEPDGAELDGDAETEPEPADAAQLDAVDGDAVDGDTTLSGRR